MRYLLCQFLVLSAFGTLLSGCERCGPDTEPPLTIRFYRPDTSQANQLNFTQIISLNGSLNRRNVKPDSLLILPLSLTTDSTVYVFIRPTRTDTLAVRYRRTFSYQSTKCGYVLDLSEPVGKPIVKTTFRTANAYLDYQRNGLFRSPGPDVDGIIADIQL